MRRGSCFHTLTTDSHTRIGNLVRVELGFRNDRARLFLFLPSRPKEIAEKIDSPCDPKRTDRTLLVG
jgi:hypothetical protein